MVLSVSSTALIEALLWTKFWLAFFSSKLFLYFNILDFMVTFKKFCSSSIILSTLLKNSKINSFFSE